MLSISNIIQLSKSGFDAQTIEMLNTMSTATQGGQPANSNAAGAQNILTPLNNANGTPPVVNPVPAPAAPGSDGTAAYIKALQDLNARLATGQLPTKEQTTEEILAGIINPPSVTNHGGNSNG